MYHDDPDAPLPDMKTNPIAGAFARLLTFGALAFAIFAIGALLWQMGNVFATGSLPD